MSSRIQAPPPLPAVPVSGSQERLIAIAFNIRGSFEAERLVCTWSPVMLGRTAACLRLALRYRLGVSLQLGASGTPGTGLLMLEVARLHLGPALGIIIDALGELGFLTPGVEVAAYCPDELFWRIHYPTGGDTQFERHFAATVSRERDALDLAFMDEAKRLLMESNS